MVKVGIPQNPFAEEVFSYDTENPTRYTEGLSFMLCNALNNANLAGGFLSFADNSEGIRQAEVREWIAFVQNKAQDFIYWSLTPDSERPEDGVFPSYQPIEGKEDSETFQKWAILNLFHSITPLIAQTIWSNREQIRAAFQGGNIEGTVFKALNIRGFTSDYITAFTRDMKDIVSSIASLDSPTIAQIREKFETQGAFSTLNEDDNPVINAILKLLVELCLYAFQQFFIWLGKWLGDIKDENFKPFDNILKTALCSKDGENSLLHLLAMTPLKIYLDNKEVWKETVPDFEND